MLRYRSGRKLSVLALGVVLTIPPGYGFAQGPHDHEKATGAAGSTSTPSPPGAAAYFVDVKNGDTLPTKTVLHFGLKGMGVAPAGVAKPNSGHHHLLIDADLPPLDAPVPSDPQHLHFGGGQTEAEVTLPPGRHTLQLLLADQDHVPHNPPVVSERITVTVVDDAVPPPQVEREPSAASARVYFVYPENGACIPGKVIVRFGLTNMGIAPAGLEKHYTGHHHLLIDTPLPSFDAPIPSDENHLHFGTGQTEAEVTLQPGRHKLQLLFADAKHVPHDPPLFSKPISVFVGDCRPKKRHHRAHARSHDHDD